MKSDYGKSAKCGWGREYERAYLKANGEICSECKGTGWHSLPAPVQRVRSKCEKCKGIGYVEKRKKK